MSTTTRRVTIVGIGDDGPGGLAPAARQAIDEAELLIGGHRQLAWFPAHAAPTLAITDNLADVLAAIEHHARQRVVVLASGDPLFFGIGSYLSNRLGPDRLAIVPHVSSVQLAFARLALGWQDATVLSAHGRPLAPLVRPALDGTKLAILTDEVNTPGVIATALRNAGMEDCRAVVAEHLGGPRERLVDTTLFQLPEQSLAALNVLVLLRDQPDRPPLPLGRPDEDFAHHRGQITKAEVRAISLSKLQLRRGSTVWDIGAGSGAVAIEAALLSAGEVYAIERSADQAAVLAVNIERWQAARVRLIQGEAPAALTSLPTPDAVFVGGSGGHLVETLDIVRARLRAGGRLVLNIATLGHLAAARSWLGASGMEDQELVQVQVARAVGIAGDVRLAALNPIWILAASQPAAAGD